jgi:hypothetical protein
MIDGKSTDSSDSTEPTETSMQNDYSLSSNQNDSLEKNTNTLTQNNVFKNSLKLSLALFAALTFVIFLLPTNDSSSKNSPPITPVFVEADRALGETATDIPVRSCMAQKAKEFFAKANALSPGEIDYNKVLDYLATPEQEDTDWDRGVLTRGTIPYQILVKCRANLVANSIALGDLDGDNLPEIAYFLSDGSFKLFWNESSGRFTPNPLPQLTRNCGDFPCFLTGTTFVDANLDGLLDIVAAWPQGGPLMTLYNKGNRTFEETPVYTNSLQKISANDWTVTVTDLDLDGISDIIVSQRQYFTQIESVKEQGSNTRAFRIFYGTGIKEDPWVEKTLDAFPSIQVLEGGFDRISQKALTDEIKYTDGPGPTGTFTAVVADFDRDGWPDIYAASDYNIPRIYFAKPGGREFYEYTRESGVLVGMQNTMGAAAVDWNEDGWMDIVATDIDEALGECASLRACKEVGGHRVLINNKDKTFTDIGREVGISDAGWGFGFTLADLNLDGHRDFLVGTGDLSASRAESHFRAMFQEPVLLLGDGSKWFDSSTSINRPLTAITAMTVIGATDIDGDKKADLILSGFENKTPFILLNRTEGLSTSFKIQTIGKKGTAASLPLVKVKIEIPNRPNQVFLASGFTSNFLLSASNSFYPIGLGDSDYAVITVTFPNQREVKRTLKAGNSYVINEVDAR